MGSPRLPLLDKRPSSPFPRDEYISSFAGWLYAYSAGTPVYPSAAMGSPGYLLPSLFLRLLGGLHCKRRIAVFYLSRGFPFRTFQFLGFDAAGNGGFPLGNAGFTDCQ